MRRVLIVPSAAALMLAIGGMAAGKLKEESVQFTADQEEERTAFCKPGREAVAGGFFVARDESTVLPVFESARSGERGWSYRLYGVDPSPATAYVYCDKKQPGLKSETVTRELKTNFVPERVSAECKQGQEAVSGGFNAPTTELVVAASKRIDKRTWEARFLGPEGSVVSVFAYCDGAKPKLKTKQESITVATGESETSTAKCKRRKQELRSGGFEMDYFVGMDEEAGDVNGSRRQGKRRWEVTGAAYGNDPEMTAYAYCDKKKKKND